MHSGRASTPRRPNTTAHAAKCSRARRRTGTEQPTYHDVIAGGGGLAQTRVHANRRAVHVHVGLVHSLNNKTRTSRLSEAWRRSRVIPTLRISSNLAAFSAERLLRCVSTVSRACVALMVCPILGSAASTEEGQCVKPSWSKQNMQLRKADAPTVATCSINFSRPAAQRNERAQSHTGNPKHRYEDSPALSPQRASRFIIRW